MKFINEYRDAHTAQQYARAIERLTTQPGTIIEVCGGQTHAIVRFGVDEPLPKAVTRVYSPGCPVCVTPVEMLDTALDSAARQEVIFCSFGDKLRVPGTRADLLAVKAQGGDVHFVYSPLGALRLAREHPGKQVVFFAVGFGDHRAAGHVWTVTGYHKYEPIARRYGVPMACWSWIWNDVSR